METVDLELFTGFEDTNGNDLYEHDTIMIDQEPHSIVWSTAKGMWVAETDNSEVPFFEVAIKSTNAIEIHAADCRCFECVESLL